MTFNTNGINGNNDTSAINAMLLIVVAIFSQIFDLIEKMSVPSQFSVNQGVTSL